MTIPSPAVDNGNGPVALTGAQNQGVFLFLEKVKLKPWITGSIQVNNNRMKICPNCNKEFQEKYKEQKFCCRDCSGHYSGNKSRTHTNNSKQKTSNTLKLRFLKKLGLVDDNTEKSKIDYILENYNKTLEGLGYKINSSIHVIQKPIIRTCAICGKEFQTIKSKYCSEECLKKRLSQCGKKGGKISAEAQQRRSKNEILMAELCSEYFSSILTNKAMFNGWDADIIIPDYKIAILWNGQWHYKQISKKQSLKQVQSRDKIKLQQIKKCGYTPYIIKDLGKFNKKFVNEEFSKLLTYLEHK